MRRAYLESQRAPKETPAGQRRQKKSEWYAAQASSSGGVSPQVEAIPHCISIPWPYSFAEMGPEFMWKWIDEGDQRGFNLRLSGWRNSHWKESLEQCASMYRLRITQKEKKPDPTGAVELFFEFVKALREMGFREESLPWQQIIEWWDGEDRTGITPLMFCSVAQEVFFLLRTVASPRFFLSRCDRP